MKKKEILETILKTQNNNYSKLEELEKKQQNITSQVEELIKELNLINKIVNDTAIISNNINNITSRYLYVNPELTHLKIDNKKIKLLIIGFFGATNLGDEMMLQTLLEYFKNTRGIEITVMIANNCNYNILNYNLVKFIHYPQTIYDFDIISDYYDIIIIGGGALLDDIQYGVNDVNEISLSKIYIELSIQAIRKNKKVYAIGLSTNKELSNIEYIEKLQEIIEKSNYFSVRDKNSLKTLENCKINIKKVKLIDDIILANDFNVNTINKKNINIGIVLICTDCKLDTYNDELIKIVLAKYDKNENYTINLIPFYNYNNCDINYYKKIQNRYKNKNIKIKFYVNTLMEIENTINQQDLMISMRYHASLISLFLNKKTLSIIDTNIAHYENKMKYLIEEYGLINKQFYISNINEDLLSKLETIINKKETPKLNIQEQIKVINRSKKTIKKIIKMIEKNEANYE